MKKLLVIAGFTLFVAGCDQSVLAPVNGGGTYEPWNESERSQHFLNTYSGSWAAYCQILPSGTSQQHIYYNQSSGLLTTKIFEDQDCKKLKETKLRSFAFKPINAWEYSDHFVNYAVKIKFDQSSEGDVAEYISLLYHSSDGFLEQQASVMVMKNGQEILQTEIYGTFYSREAK